MRSINLLVLLFLLPWSVAWPAVAFVQGTTNSTTCSTPCTATFGNATTSGNGLSVFIVSSGSGASQVTSVTDATTSGCSSPCNTYTNRVAKTFQSGVGGCELWTADNITGGANHAITVAFSTGGIIIQVAEYSGQANPAIDVAGADVSANHGGSSTSGTISLTAGTGGLYIADFTGSLGNTFTAGSGFSQPSGGGQGNMTNTGTFFTNGEFKAGVGTGSQAATATFGSSTNWQVCAIILKASGGGGSISHKRGRVIGMLNLMYPDQVWDMFWMYAKKLYA